MRILLLIAAIVGFAVIVRQWQRRQLSVWAALAWSALWVAVAIVAFVPELTNRIADMLGIGRGADVILYSAIVAIIAILFRMSIRIEQLDRAITQVTRAFALRDHDARRDRSPS